MADIRYLYRRFLARKLGISDMSNKSTSDMEAEYYQREMDRPTEPVVKPTPEDQQTAVPKDGTTLSAGLTLGAITGLVNVSNTQNSQISQIQDVLKQAGLLK